MAMKWIWFSSKKTFLKGMVCFFLSTYSKFHFLLHVWHRLLTTIKLFCVRYAKSQTERERRKFLVRLSLTSLLFLKSIIANYIFVDLFYEAHNKISKLKILSYEKNGFDDFYFVHFTPAKTIIAQWSHPSNFNVKRMFILAYTDSKRLMVSLTYGQ